MTTTTTTTAAAAPDTGTPESPLDLLCVGIGPFGLCLACLADPLEDVRAAFLDRRPEFDWHPGLLFEDATLQVPFLADLVTMADPTSSYSFLNWLKTTGRLYSFYVRESFYPLRRDYNAYCRWAAARLPGLHWGHDVVSVRRPEGSGAWQVTSAGPQGETTWWTRHLVVGAGTAAVLPEVLSGAGAAAVHASQYLHERDRLVARDHVTVLGSGQSAAEVVLDLLEAPQAPAVDWITRSPRFYPMEYTELTLELTSPEYLDHFRCLPEDRRDELNRSQPQLHRGISAETISRIYETLIVRRAAGDRAPVRLLAATELTDAQPHDGRTLLSWRSTESGQRRETLTDAVIAGTGYLPAPLPWLEPVLSQLSLDAAGRLTPDRWHRASTDGSLHVLNHTEHTHALTAPDLGMGPMRAAIVLDHVTGRRPYPVERRTMFQSFGLERSGTPADEWVSALLRVYLLPVAHLLLSRSIALMPHGENVVLRLADGLPVGAFWKDLGEEIVVMDDQTLPTGTERIRTVIEPSQQELSVHTDVLDGVLRHLGALLHADGLLAEQVHEEHREAHPQHWAAHDLLRPQFEHSCLNRLQLRDPQQMVDLSDPAGTLAKAGHLQNPLAAHRITAAAAASSAAEIA